MTTPLTSDQAIALLREQPDAYDTPDKLRALAAQVDADASGRVTVLYSGPSAKGVSSSQLIKSMLESGEDIRVIDNSEVAKLLQSREFLHSVAKVYGLDDFRPLADGTYRGPAADWLYHPTQGPWADASARFADATVGEVRAIVGDADPNRVFGATEVPHMLANEKVPAIEGIPRESLVARQSTHGTQAAFEMIAARSREHVGLLRVPTDVPVNYAGQLLRDERGQLRLDSREYFAATNLESNAPPIPAETRALGGSMHPPSEYARAGQLHLQELQMQRISVHSPRTSAAAKGLGAAAVAATAYDIADTAHDVGRLRAQGNAAAAEDRITRFAAQNLGGWGGAAAGMGAGAAAGVESGPGLLVTGAVGGVIGAVAGDQVAGWIRDYKINHQDDRQGHAWTFDPDQPGRGWTRIERSIDVEAMRYSTRDAPIYQTRTLTADAALSDELTYKASSRSIGLALGAPPQNRDPFRLPVAATDGPPHQPFETDRAWVRDAQTRQWQLEIKAALDGRIPTTRYEPASPDRTARLEQQSQAIVAENATRTPAAMAARYRDACASNGWLQYGPLPEAVTDALRHPGKVVGSDGQLYERNANGQWMHQGLLWDSTAKGNLKNELDTTYQQQQRFLNPQTLETVTVRPEPGARPLPVSPPQAVTLPIPGHLQDFRHPEHPQHNRYQGVLREVHQMEEANGIASGPHSERLAAAWVDELGRAGKGFTLDRFVMRGHEVVALSRRDNYFEPQRELSLNADQALSRPVEQASVDWAGRTMPHLGQPQPVEPATTLATTYHLAEHDLRHPNHAQNGQYATLREQVADTYAKAGILRSDAQLERATAAVALDLHRHGLDRADHLYLLPHQDGTLGPDSGIGAMRGQYPLQLHSQTPGEALQQAPDESYRQLAQVTRQQAIEQQRQAVAAQPQGPQLG